MFTEKPKEEFSLGTKLSLRENSKSLKTGRTDTGDCRLYSHFNGSIPKNIAHVSHLQRHVVTGISNCKKMSPQKLIPISEYLGHGFFPLTSHDLQDPIQTFVCQQHQPPVLVKVSDTS